MGKELSDKFDSPRVVRSDLRIYSKEEAINSSLDYFRGDELAAKKWVEKYALKDSQGNLYEGSPNQMHHRMASEIARIEAKYGGENQLSEGQIFDLFDNFRYLIPGGSNMFGIGNNKQIVSLSNCFVIGHGADSYGGIMAVDEEQVQLMKRRGGVGHDLSHIRPYESHVNNSALTSTGVVPFMERYSNSTKEVAQGGRRGALMLSLDIRHPDAERFIDAKLDTERITGANVSIKIRDDFMKAVIEDKPYLQQFPVDSNNPIYTREIDARALWEKIIHNAWKSAEPGVLFWDTIERESVPDVYSEFGYKSTSTNPCGEIPLCPYDSCRLLSINLFNYVENPFTSEARFNKEKFRQHARYAQRVMDDIVDLEGEKIEEILRKIDSDGEPEELKIRERTLWQKIREKNNGGRRTGIGVTSEGDMLAALGYTYGTPEATEFSTEIHRTLATEVYRGSVELAKERGAFGIYNPELEKNNPFIKRLAEVDPNLYEEMVKHGRRNIALLTIAPTGTVSMMSQTTSGIEPAYLLSYVRSTKVNKDDPEIEVSRVDKDGTKWQDFNVFHHKFRDWLIINGYNLEEVEKMDPESQEFKRIIEVSPYHKATSADVDYLEKVRMQGEIQKWVDHSISVTINMPEDVSEEIVGATYMRAWEVGCKGMTVYREGSRQGVMNRKSNKLEDLTFPKDRPEIIDADLWRFKNSNDNGGEDWIAFIGTINGKPYEIFTGKPEGSMLYIPEEIDKGKIKKIGSKIQGKGSQYDFIYPNEVGFENVVGGISHQFNREYWNYARLVSGLLREGSPVTHIIKIVEKLDEEMEGFNTWKKGVLRALRKYVPDGEEKGIVCSECNFPIIFQNGCETCGCGEKCS